MAKTPITSFFTAMMRVLAAHPMAAYKPSIQAALSEHMYTNALNISEDVSTSRRNAITNAVKKCSPAIVGINVTETRTQYYRDPWEDFYADPMFRQFYGDRPHTYKRDYEVRSLGSGFLISADGYILTNDHVAGNASKIVVTMTDGSKHDARIIGTDPVTDVAVLKIEGSGLPFLKLSNSEDVEVGEWAIAFGNPFGLFDNNAKPTVTVGVVSNIGVSFTQPGEGGEDRVYKNMIQTDAAISSGNSGGPLVNSLGEVIGVNTVIYSTSQSSRGSGSIGIGFAIPINRVKAIVDRLQKQGPIQRDFWTGMKLTAIDENVMKYFQLQSADGVLISEVVTGGPADDAGIEPGDVIIAINGQQTLRDDDVNIAILDGEVNQKMKLTVLRAGVKKDVTMTLLQRPRSGSVRN